MASHQVLLYRILKVASVGLMIDFLLANFKMALGPFV